MALPPTIPTSFVPHSSTAERQFKADLTGAYEYLTYAIFGIVVILAIGVFSYSRILTIEKVSKDKALQEEVSAIDAKTVDGFLRLRDRLNSSQALLNGHVAFTGLFSSLEKIMPTSVRFNKLHLSFDSSGTAQLEGTGAAKSFNALAAASAAFATDGRIKDAIFSNINVSSKDKSVSFSLTTTLDPSIMSFSL